MKTPKIPFTLEQEARYRQYFCDVLDGEDYQKPSTRNLAGVLVNMALFELVNLIEYVGFNPVDEDIEALKRCADFFYLECYYDEWLYNPEFRIYRLMIEEREKKLLGKVSNSLSLIKAQHKRDVLEFERELRERERQNAENRHDRDINDFKQMIATEKRGKRAKKRRETPKGFLRGGESRR
jgi:hypothetical protein